MRFFPALFSLFFSVCLTAQMESRAQVLDNYLDAYNAQRASRDWATTEVADVAFTVTGTSGLVAVLNRGATRIELDRAATDPMDGIFPLTISGATVIHTNATVLFIAPSGEHHFAFTLLDDPQVPALTDGYLTLFVGDGLSRRTGEE